MGRYRMRKSQDHPLASGGKYISAHRYVLYDKIGPGTHPCHWCKSDVTWMLGRGTRRGALVVDHVDGNRGNNAPDNLVPSCQSCNVARGQLRVQDDELFIERPNGKGRLRAVKANCEFCGSEFLAIPAQLKNGKGRFCSRSCARSGPRGH